jgi:hypothetical protein
VTNPNTAAPPPIVHVIHRRIRLYALGFFFLCRRALFNVTGEEPPAARFSAPASIAGCNGVGRGR